MKKPSFIIKTLLFCTLFTAIGLEAKATDFGPARMKHAQELMGSYFSTSLVSKEELYRHTDQFVHQWVERHLPESYKRFSPIIANAILEEANRYEFDPMFIISVIMTESSFRPRVRGSSGELGLMQLMPNTGEWKAKQLGMSWQGPAMLENPIINIRIGTAYLAYLRSRFDGHSRLYLSAYNMGQGNVRSALSRNVWPQDYARKVMGHYLDFYKELNTSLPSFEMHAAGRNVASHDNNEA